LKKAAQSNEDFFAAFVAQQKIECQLFYNTGSKQAKHLCLFIFRVGCVFFAVVQ
jgi:hypothetical protein